MQNVQKSVLPNDLDPIRAAVACDGPSTLAIVTQVLKPFYRPVGSMLCILPGGELIGNVSSGCIEADLALHAEAALAEERPIRLSYGANSPFMDLRLPCGGGIEVVVIPRPDRRALARVLSMRDERCPCNLHVNTLNGDLTVTKGTVSKRSAPEVSIYFPPEIKLIAFGNGPEADAFSSLGQVAGYETVLVTSNPLLAKAAHRRGTQAVQMTDLGIPPEVKVDDRTALVLFFHDHEAEPPILLDAFATSAFFIGAQGSRRTSQDRLATLRKLGVSETQLIRLHGPVGLLPGARDPRTLALSILAEIVAKATSPNQ